MRRAAAAGALLLLAASAEAAQAAASGGRKADPAPSFDGLAKAAAAAQTAGRLDEAIGHYRKALGLKRDWLEGHWALARLLYDRDRCAEAARHFTRVVAARPRDGLALALRALCHVRLRDYDLALAELQRAQALGIPNAEADSVARFNLALLVNRAGNPEAAFAILRPFAAQGKDSLSVIEAFGLVVLRRREMPGEAPAEKWEMIRLAGRGGYHMARGRRTDVGRLALEELVSRFPAEPNVHYALGLYVAPEEPEAALEEFRKELARDPAHVASLVQVASVELRRGQADQARSAAQKAVEIDPGVPAARLLLGRALLEAGEVDRAVQELEKGAKQAPESPEIHFSLARAYQRAGRDEDAARARREFLRLEKSGGRS
jgi:tetratricopeptide (TPR) repeat protein